MAVQVNFFCFLMYFSVWLAIWSLKISTFVLIKVLLTYLLKALGSMAKAELLLIINESFPKGVVPGIWEKATILPLKKAGKSPGAISSYRPVNLISCVQWREWYTTAFTNWPRQEARFHKLRSCEDQALRTTQTISDDFQAASHTAA